MTRRTSQLSFANRAICIVLSALLAITMMPAAAFAAMGEYADSAADAQQQSASEFTGSEDQSQQGEYAPDEVIIVYEGDMPDKAEPAHRFRKRSRLCNCRCITRDVSATTTPSRSKIGDQTKSACGRNLS